MTSLGLVRTPAAAIAFLTRLPVGRVVSVRAEDVARSTPFFPLVGGAVGLGCGLLAVGLADVVPALAAGVVAVAAALLVTGGLHIDALADTADALGASRARALEIMRDHRLGAFGATALVLVLVLDASLLGALAAAGEAPVVALAAASAGRAAMLPAGVLLPYARSGDGQGRVLESAGRGRVGLALAVALLLALPAGAAGLVALAASFGVAAALGLFCWRWLGGVTGDTLGATAKLGETAALLAGAAVVL